MAGKNNSPQARRARAKLTPRHYEVLEHLARYRLSLRETLRDELFGDSAVNAVSKVTTRMVRDGFLRSHPLDEKRKYWTFGPEACALFGVPPQKANPLGPQALVDELGTLLFCLGGPTRRKRLTVAEVGRLFPGVAAAKLRSSRYYLDYGGGAGANAQPRLGLIRVDGGGPPAHVVRKLVEDVDKRREVPAARALIADRRFVIAVVTAHPAKCDEIRDAVNRVEGWPVPLRVVAREGLTPAVLSLRSRVPAAGA